MKNIGAMIEETDTKAVLAMSSMLGMFGYLFWQKQIPESLMTLVSMMVGYYFARD